jgi:hypothetical protein
MLSAAAVRQVPFIASMTLSAIAIWALADACNRDESVVRAVSDGLRLALTESCAVALLVDAKGMLVAAAVGIAYLVGVRARVRAVDAPLSRTVDVSSQLSFLNSGAG